MCKNLKTKMYVLCKMRIGMPYPVNSLLMISKGKTVSSTDSLSKSEMESFMNLMHRLGVITRSASKKIWVKNMNCDIQEVCKMMGVDSEYSRKIQTQILK
jgi:hypothetical protein